LGWSEPLQLDHRESDLSRLPDQFIDLGTVTLAMSIEFAQACATRGAGFIDCPVGGTVIPTRTAALLGFAGGAAQRMSTERTVLELLCPTTSGP
jgi:3-hydroxyisobutyrate dehydrogenase-like beta-hydroxyacid dehydrogenase